ncbi:MAG: hypothetical protein J07HX64_00962 [halophilic archaeon J07HX64]|nr:MAG: hypothetical protein J07HX64_00962 [halophilic archaeon J07HX64]
MAALEKKIDIEQVTQRTTAREAFAPTQGGTVAPAESGESESAPAAASAAVETDPTAGTDGGVTTAGDTTGDHTASAQPGPATEESAEREPETLGGHVGAVIENGTKRVRLLDDELSVITEADADAAFDTVADSDPAPEWVILDGTVTQRLLDVAAQRSVGQLVGAATGEFVKQPAGVRVRTAADVL